MKFFISQRKRILSFTLAFALILSVFGIMPLSASAAVGDVFTDGAFTFTVTEDNTVQLTAFDNSVTDVVIPSKVSDENGVEYTVTSILNSTEVFNSNIDIESVVIPGTVKNIPSYIFQNCTFLESVTLEEGVETLGSTIFAKCSSLTSIILPKSLVSIPMGTFSNCTSLKDVYINSDVNIQMRAFNGCTALENIYCYSSNITFASTAFTGSNSTFVIHGYAGSTAETFANEKGFTFEVIQEEEPTTEEPTTEEPTTEEPTTEEPTTEEPTTEEPTTEEPTTEEPTTEAPTSAAVGTIFTEGAFTFTVTENNTVQLTAFDNSVTDVVIPSKVSDENGVEYTVTSILNSTEVFNSNIDIESVVIPGTVKNIPSYIFQNCTFLESVTLEEGVETLGSTIFAKCSSLTSIILPKSLVSIPMGTFSNCTSLKDVYINSDVNIQMRAFNGCTALENIYCYSSNITFASTAFTGSNSTFVIHGYAGSTAETFANEKGFTFEVIQEEEPTTEEPTTEEPTTDATEPDTTKPVDPPTPDTYIVAGVEAVFGVDWDGTAVANMMLDTDGDGIYTFTLTNVQPITDAEFKIVKNGTEWIGDPELSGPYNNFKFTVEQVSDVTFSYNTATTEVTVNIVPVGDTEDTTVSTEPETTEVTEPTTEPDTSIFEWETINDGTAVKITGIKDEYKTQTDIEIPAEINGLPVTTIGASAFVKGKAVNVTLPASVTAIEDKAFYYSSIKTLTFAENSQLQTIGVSAFEQSNLANITIPASVTTIGNRAFYKTWIVTLTFEENSQLQTIGESAFQSSMVMYVTIPASVTIISDSAFRNCSSLTTLTFEENSQLQEIGNNAFSRSGSDDRLSSVELPESLKVLGYQAFYNRANLLSVKIYSKDVVFGDAENGAEVFNVLSGTSNLKLYGYLDSTTQAYAEENEHIFRDIELDTTALKELISTAKAIDSSGYTEESYAKLSEELEKANTTYRSAVKWETTHIEVNQAVIDLQAAIDGLVEYVEPATSEPTTSEPTTSEPTTSEPDTTAPIVYVDYIVGDADGDLKVTIDDATAIQKHIVELITLTGTDLLAADINGDGTISIEDATLLQMWIAEYQEAAGYKIGEKVTTEVTPTDPQPTDPQPTDPQPTDPQPTDPQPTDPQPTEPESEFFYVPNYVSWLTDLGGKLWIYNDATDEFETMDYGTDFNCFYIELPNDWTELSIYRTPFDTTEETFDINSPWDDETNTGIILNKWEHLGDRGTNNCYKITGDGEGLYTMFDDENIDDERTIYFDNSKTQWGAVYIYGWSFGILQDFVPMEPEGNDIWSYTFYDDLPVDGVKGFLFVNQTNWTGATQTTDLATQEGKNLFTPIPGGQKLNGTWSVYTPN